MEYIGKRISILKKQGEVSFAILSSAESWKKNLLFLWLLLWTASGIIVFVYALRFDDVTGLNLEQLQQRKLFLFVWFCFWLYFEYLAAKAYRWRSSGVEKLWIKNNRLYMKRETGGKGKTQSYDIDVIKDLRIYEASGELMKVLSKSYWVVGGETLAFDYYGKIIRFGMQLDEREAAELLKKLQQALRMR